MEPEKYLWSKAELQSLLTLLKTDEEVVLASPRLRMFGVVSNGKSSTIFITEATVPEDDHNLVQTPVDGRTENLGAVFLSKQAAHTSQVAIGSELSHMLGVTKGENLTLLLNTKDGMANAVDVEIANVFNTGNPATDDKFILTNFSLVQQLYDTKGAERIVVTLKNPDDLSSVKARLLQKATKAGFRLEAQGWD